MTGYKHKQISYLDNTLLQLAKRDLLLVVYSRMPR